MSATSSTNTIMTLASLARALQPIGAHIREIVKNQSKNYSDDAMRRALAITAKTPAFNELPSPPAALKDTHQLEEQFAAQLRRANGKLATLAVEKTATIAAILSAPLVAADISGVETALHAIDGARTTKELQKARAKLRDVMNGQHAAVWLNSLQEITQSAFVAIGFQPLPPDLRSPREIRLSAVNMDGKVLVSELRLAQDGTPSMATEVVNGCGPECEGILERFEAALAKNVRGSKPVRKPTGGVCQLDAAVDFVKRRVRRAPLASSVTRVKAPRRRTAAVLRRS